MDAAFTLCTAVWGVPELAASCAVVQGLTKMFEGAGADKIKENVSAFGILIHKRIFINPREENNNGKVELMWYLPL